MLPRQFKRFIYIAGAFALAIAAQASHAQQPPMVGGDRDAHGCIPSAGYSWCAKEKACVQPWVLAAKKGFPKGDKAAFDAYCQ